MVNKRLNMKISFVIILSLALSYASFAQQQPQPGGGSGTTKTTGKINLDSIGNVIDSLNSLLLLQSRIQYTNTIFGEKDRTFLYNKDETMTVVRIEPRETNLLYFGDAKIKEIKDKLRMTVMSFYGNNDVASIPSYSSSDLPQSVLASAKCVCAIIHKSNLSDTAGGYILKSSLLRQKKIWIEGRVVQLCDNEPFIDQINPAIGTCWAFKNNLIVTADHCFDTVGLHDYKNYYFIFDFLESKSGAVISKDRVFKPTGKIPLKPEDLTKEFSIIQVDRAIPKARYARLETDENRTFLIRETKLYMIGHPLGLPLKYTPNGEVFRFKNEVLITNLDAYAGNSGSPVFSADSDKVVGILVSGNVDFKEIKNNCCNSYPYSSDFPLKDIGEKVVVLTNSLKKY
jgi:hypothetical protein